MSTEEKILFLLKMLAAPALALVISVLLTRFSIKFLKRYGFAAEMGERHIHTKVTPTAGGIGMIVAFTISCLLFNLWIKLAKPSSDIVWLDMRFFLPVALLFAIGICDDRFGMRASVKLFGQIIASVTAWYCDIRLDNILGWALPDYLSCILTVFWFLLYINAFNLIDGLDGLAAGLAVLAGVTMGAVLMIGHHWTEAVVALTLAGACLGFLRYNFHPARLFMGDTGSMFLGYVLAALGLKTSNYDTSVFAIIIPMMACGVPLIDTALAVWRRSTFKILSKRSWREIMSADRSHLHHRILDSHHGNQSRTALTIYILAAILSTVGIIASIVVDMLPMLAVLLIVLSLVLVLRKFAVVEIYNSTEIVFKGLAMPRRGILVNILHPVYDLLVISGAFFCSIILFEEQGNERDFLYRTVISALILLLTMICCKTYKVYWLRAGTPDYLNLAYSILLGFIIILIVNAALNYFNICQWSLIVLLPAGLITMVGILGERIHLRCLQLMLPRYFHHSEFASNCVPTVLYGAGAQLSAYQSFSNLHLRKSGMKVVGIIDNDMALQGLHVYGYRIIGDISRLDELFARYNFRKIVVITPNPVRCNYEILKNFCNKNEVELTFFTMREADEPLEIRENTV
ncbi:MAG: hypothetical protein E7047_05165 [Lentisphaerae bacterium]|nr:hypothetical protein [Lentisphaerota bacterium]